MLAAALATSAAAAAALVAATLPRQELTGRGGRADAALLALRVAHLALSLLIVAYPLATLRGARRRAEDVAFFVVASAVVGSWYVAPGGECVLSSVEKRMLDAGYVPGAAPRRHVYLESVLGARREAQLPLFVAMLAGYASVALRLVVTAPWPTAPRAFAAAAVVAAAVGVLRGMVSP